MEKNKKRICLALELVKAEDAISKVINSKYNTKYEITQNVRSKEALYDTVNKEKYDVIILREDLSGNIDLIDVFKAIRASSEDAQIIFFMKPRENGDPFFIEMFLFNIFDFIVLPNIKLEDIFNFLEHPRAFRDILRYLPIRAQRTRNLIIEANKDLQAPLKVDKEGDIDEVISVNVGNKKEEIANIPKEEQVVVKEVVKYIEKPIIKEIIREVPVPIEQIPQEIVKESSIETEPISNLELPSSNLVEDIKLRNEQNNKTQETLVNKKESNVEAVKEPILKNIDDEFSNLESSLNISNISYSDVDDEEEDDI